jgi:hypothetical protein
MNKQHLPVILIATLFLAWAGAAMLSGCSEDNPLTGAISPADDPADEFELTATARELVFMWGDEPPAGLVSVDFLGESLTFWPYTGMSFDGSPMDPINLVFKGEADPVQIRAALFALDGDRTAFGFPDAPPFNQTWSEAIGDVQTTYAEGDGWTGSVIQLQLGDYQPIRVHLRLFQTGARCAGGGVWTLGGAHFEVMIPGTADHQVLSWEIAEQVVMVDLLRSGLLDPTAPMMPTGLINQAPSFRDIPAVIYNELPDELKLLITGSTAPSPVAVPLVSDGQGTILNLAGRAPAATGRCPQSLTFVYDQVVPKPFCMDGPYDYVHVAGPVTFTKTADVDKRGGYTYRSDYRGDLTVTPVDVTQSPPVPVGLPFSAVVSGLQHGQTGKVSSRVVAIDRRVAPQDGGTELLLSRLMVGAVGRGSYRLYTSCLTD